MTMQERFEVWYRSIPGGYDEEEYFYIWKAAYASALERAEEICEAVTKHYEWSPHHAGGAAECGVQIHREKESS